MTRTLFRSKAMSKSTGPEPLDERIRVVTVRGWVSLGIGVAVALSLLAWAELGTTRQQVDGVALLMHEPHTFPAEAPAYGEVLVALPPVGTLVTEGQEISTVQRTDQPSTPPLKVAAPVTGLVIGVAAQPGTAVVQGQDLAYIEPTDAPLVAQVFVPTSQGKRVKPGLAAEVTPSTAPAARYGLMKASVRSVSPFSLTPDQILTITNNPVLTNQIVAGPPVLLVTLTLQPSADNKGFAWTSGSGPPFAINSGTLGSATVTISTSRPIDSVFGGGAA
jgi:HlyD family secretion protein